MHATRKLVFPSGPIDVTGTFQVESEAISNARPFLFCAIPIPHLEINAEHISMLYFLILSPGGPQPKERQPEKGVEAPGKKWQYFQTTHPLTLGSQSEESFFSALFSVSWSKFGAAEILPPVHREDLCVLVSTEKENIELDPL